MLAVEREEEKLRFLLYIKHSALSLEDFSFPLDVENTKTHAIKSSSAVPAWCLLGTSMQQLHCLGQSSPFGKVLYSNCICHSGRAPASLLVWTF